MKWTHYFVLIKKLSEAKMTVIVEEPPGSDLPHVSALYAESKAAKMTVGKQIKEYKILLNTFNILFTLFFPVVRQQLR